MLRPRPVEVALALGALALDLLTVLVDRRQERLREVALPAFGRAEDPLDLLVAADLDDGRLMAGGNDDGVVFRVIVDGVDVQPVAARARADDVAEVVRLFSGGEFLGGERLAGLSGVDVKADGALVEDLEHVGAVDVEDVRKAPFVDHVALFVHFGNHVADGAHVLAVGTDVVGARHAQEVVPVLGVVHRVRVVVVAHREEAVEDFAAHDVVLDVALAVAPGERAVLILTEAHHHAAPFDGIRFEN